MADASNPLEPTQPELKDILTGRRRLLQGGAAALAGAAAMGAAMPRGEDTPAPVAKPMPHGAVKGGWLGMNRPKA